MADTTKVDTFIQGSPHPSWLATPQGHCVYANPALERLTGLKPNQINQADWRGFLLEEDRAAASAFWQRSLATGTPYRAQVRMRGSAGVPEYIDLIAFGHKAGDGTELWLFTGLEVTAVAAPERPQFEEQLQATLNVLPAYTWYALPSGAVTFVNERSGNYLGLPKDHPLRFGVDMGADWDSHISLLHPDDHEIARRAWATRLRTGCAGEVSFRVRNAEGGYRWFLSRAEPLRASDGTLLYWIGDNLDIEDRKCAEDRIRGQEAELRQLLDLTPQHLFVFGPDGIPQHANRAALEYFGVDENQLLVESRINFVHPDDRARFLSEREKGLLQGSPHEFEARLLKHDGSFRWFLFRRNPFKDDEGHVTRWYGAATDIEDRKRAEEALGALSRDLQESKARLEEAQRIAHIGYWEWDLATNRIKWSDETYRIYGMRPQECPMDLATLQEKIFPEDWQRAMKATLGGGDRYDMEYRLMRPTGEVRIVQSRGEVKRDASGRPYQVFGTGQDITDRKRAEQRLRESEAYLAEAERLSQTGSWAWNPATGDIRYWSEMCFCLLGFDPAGPLPRFEEFFHQIHPDDQAATRERFDKAICDKADFELDYRVLHPKKGTRDIHVVGHAALDALGNLDEFVGTVIDVTERKCAEDARKRAEEELRKSEAYLAEAQRLSQTGSWAWSPAPDLPIGKSKHADIRYWSEECYRVLSFDPQDGLPRFEEFFQRIHPDDQPGVRELIETAIRGKAEWEADYRIVHPDGPIKDIHVVGHPVLSVSDHLVEFVGTVVDVTERRRAEQERARLRRLESDLAHIDRVSTLGEMAASLAHEIKQPIAAAITSANSCIEWLAHEPPNLDRARAAASRIDKYGNRAAEIIDRIRCFYKKSPPQRELVDVNGIVQEMLTLLKGEATRFSICMRTDLSAELPKIMVDRVQLQQVFMNLMLNGIEAMEDSGGELTVKSELQDGQLQFSVSDTGVGLPAEKTDQIFSAFFTTKPQGSGMGLAISRSIVESHGGQLWATANSEAGATFHFNLPIQVTESSPLVT